MFSVRLVTADSYQAPPLPQLDPTYSEFRGAEIKNVPIVRIFGTTPTGEKTCLHLHGAFPYMYVPFTGEDNANAYAYKLAASLDAAINISLGSATSNTPHVYQIQRVAGIPYYGYHRREHQFFKVSFYNPAMMKKATDLLQNGSVLNHRLQTHEAHIPYILQFMMDYNLHGMSLINLSNVKYRRVTQLSETKPSDDSAISPVESIDYLPSSVIRQSSCEFEVDALVSDILNRRELERGMELNPGLAAIWEEERERRLHVGLPSDNSHLVNPPSPKRPAYCATESDIYQQQRLNRRLQMISQCDESILSTGTNPTPYPLEVNDKDHLINASNLGSCSGNNLDKSQQQLSDSTSLTSFTASQGSKTSQSTHDSSVLDPDDIPLVEMLMELACDSDNQESIDDDSILGTQSSMFNNDENKSDNEDEDAADLNITCLELDSMSPWDDTEKSPSQLVPVNILEVNTEVPQSSLGEIFAQDTDAESQDSEESRLPQLDGAGDLSSYLESEEDESTKRCQELKRVSECETPILNHNLSHSDDEAFIVEDLISGLSKSNKNGNSNAALIPNATWPSYLPNETGLEQFSTINYEPLSSVLESDFDNIIGMLLSNNDETTVGINLTVEDEGIPIEAVLNGDPCFTQTAEMDKSDFAELQDQYESLLDSALVPDVYKNSHDSDIVNDHYNRLEEKEMALFNTRNLRFTTDSRNSNLSSENVTPNIQEPDAKVSKNKLSLPSVFEKIDDSCKESNRLHSDSSDYNCNVVATWEELQDPKFIPKRILKKKRFGKTRKQVLTRRPILSDSMLARKKGRFRRGPTSVNSDIVQDNVMHILNSSSNTPMEVVPSQINDEAKESYSCERLTANDCTNTTVDTTRESSEEFSKIESSSEDLSHDVASSGINDVPTRISPVNIVDNDVTKHILHEIPPSNSLPDVRNTLPGVQYSTYHVGENGNVTPILADFEELVDVPSENNKSLDNNNSENFSHYSSTRSHSGVIPFSKHKHRHCYYSLMRMRLIKKYVFTSDEIWVVEKRGKTRSLSSKVCNKNCRLPFVPLKKLDIAKKSDIKMTQLSISEMGPENLNLSCDSSKIDVVKDNYDANNASILPQSKSPEIIEVENTLQNSKHDNKLIDTRQMNCKNDIKSDGNNICDKLQLMISDSTSTQSAQISSTQNHDHIVMSKDNEPVVIRRIFKDKIYDSKVGRKKRSIILKFDDKNNSDVVTLNGHTPKIVSLSIKKKNHEDESKSMIEHCIQPELIKKKQEQRKNIEYANAAVMTIMESNENEEICNEKNGNSVLTTFTMETKMQQLRNPIINTINQDDAEISEIINRESNIISSSQCESAILIKRPEIWCSIDRNKIDLTHITQTNKLKNVEISNSQDNIQRTSPVCSKSITNLILDNNTDNIIVSKSDIPTNSHTQKFDDFDDTTLDVQLCDSIYKDDDTSNNIFEGTEAIGEPITSTDDCENVHESEQYTNAVAEVNLYAGKNYTIDAISLEIPQCLFEEDSNPESVQKKSSDMTDDNALTEKQLVEGLSSTETTLDDLISDDYDSVSTKAFNFGQEHKSDSDTLSILDNSSSTNEAQHEISMLSDAQESLTISQLAEIDDLINGNESSNDSNYTCMLSRSSTPEQLNGQLNCCNKSNEYFNEELITQMMKSILILRENNELPITDDFINDDDDDELPVDKEKSDYCASDDSSGNNSECLLKNIDENSAGSVSKYSPNKISMIRRIYSSKNKIVQKKSDYINVNTLHSAKSNVKDDKFSNNQIENLEIHETFKKNNSEEKLSDKEELVVNESYENFVSSAIDKCSSSNRNTATENILNDSTSDPQLYLRNNLNIATKSSENPCKSKMMNEFVHESNNNQVICQFEALTVEDNSISFANSVNQDSKQDMIAEKNQDLNSNHQHNDLTDKSLDNISEIVLNNEQYDNIHDDISPVVQLSTNNQYVKTDVIIEPNVRQKNLAEEVNVKVDENERENFRLLNDVDAKIESTVLKSDDEIAEKKIERNTVGVVASDNDSMLISMCRNVSIVLERLELNGLHKYLKHNQKIEACDTDMSKKMISVKNKDIQKTPTKRKQRVRFHEEVFVFESQERVPLIDVEDQVEESVNEKEQSEILIENQNLTEVSDVMDATKTEEFIGNAKSSIDSENTIVNCNEVISDAKISNNNDNDDITEMKNITIEKIKENKNEKKTVVENNCIEMAKINCEKPNGASIQNNIFNCNNKGIELLSIRNQESIKNEKVSRREPKVTNIIICRGEKCNSDAAVNQKENVLIKKFHKKSEEIEIKNTTRTMELCDKSKKKRDVDCVKEKPTLDVDNIQIKNNTMIDKFNKSWDNTSHDKPSTVNERKTKATNKKIYSNRSSVIPIDELKNCRSELQYKRKHTNISTMRTQSNTNNSINNIPLIGNITNQGSDRILRSYRTSSGYRNKIHTVSIDQKMIFTKVTISDQQLLKKTAKEKFLGHIGLCSLKPREYTWLPEHTMTGFIQLQQPNVVLQRLTPSVLKYYGYTRRFKSNRFGKRFKTSVDKFTIPAYDGPADLSSSDSEADDDITILNSEKRVCIYGSSKKNTKREVIVTPKKRKKSPNDNDDDDDDDDDDEEKEMNECKQTKHGTPKQSIAALRTSYRSPHQRSILKSPNVSGNYSPLKIIISSPKANKSTPIDINASQINKSNVVTDINTTCCVTPKRRKQLMRENLLRNRIKASSINGRKGNIRNAKMNTEHQLMGELKILDTSVTVPITQSLDDPSRDEYRREDISLNVKDTMNVRKNLFFSTDDNPIAEVSLSQQNAKIYPDKNSNKNKTLLLDLDLDIARPSTSGYINLNVDNYNSTPEYDDNEDVAELTQSNEDICLKYSPSVHSEDLNANNEDDLCNVTFTEYLSSHELSQQLILTRNRGQSVIQPSKPITILPKFNPPSIKRIIDTMETYNIPKFNNLQPFFSNQADAPGRKELAHKILNVPGKGLTDLSIFKSTMENITGINRWRRMKINEFHPARESFKSNSIRQSLAGHASVVITPLLSAPTSKNVIKWLRAREYLRKKEKKEIEAKVSQQNESKNHEETMDDYDITLQNESSDASDSSIIAGSPEQIIMSSSSRLLGRMPSRRKIVESRVQAESIVQDVIDRSSTISESSSSCGEIASSLKSIINNKNKSALFRDTLQQRPLGISYGQIECITNTIRSNVDNENMQKCKALTRYQFITIFCVEVHVITRDNLLPDPQHDSISAIFYAIQNDVPPTSSVKPLEHGVIAICDQDDNKSNYFYGSNVPFVITFVANEEKLFETFINIVNRSDAEILIGWEIESLSWGYIFQRALRLGINLVKNISRVPASQCRRDNQTSNDLSSLTDIKLPGRVVLDIWRIMKSEIALLTYTFENVMYNVMNERLPCPSFKSLTMWWESTQSRWKVVQHYSTKMINILRILEQLDIIGRTSEYARLFGIQFYEVFSRGSQFRVESIMLRLAKPLNYVAVSPSAQQRSSMRAMEALPLIMEPESMFYSDPVIVLDFQSLYPSIIIAHNYCFSTCLGRVEHIGQPDPFEFGASVLRVPKYTALKMQGKVNYAPCGVAFVKPEIRRGILPRMLIEILNTRLMVKKAMKDHSQDDKLLQRVLHSRQKGLKDLANVTYGYTAANFTGRMPCIEVGDSVVSKAKETLERAIKLVESTPKWGARVIYGDTDSLFILVPGKSKADAFNVGYEIADAVTESNLSPIKLKFEKILYPAILQTKKRYCGYMYETADQKEPKYLAKGIETVRRDGCPAVSKILEKSLKILFDTKDVSLVKQYVTKQLDKVLNGKVSLDDLTFAKEFRGLKGYRERACVPALELTRRLMKKDPRAIPRRSERVRYVIIAGAPNQALIHCVRSPWEVINDPGLRLNGTYYVTRVIIPPLNRCLNLMGVDVNMWYKEMPHRRTLNNPVAIPDNKQKQTISQYFGTIVCVACGGTSNKSICTNCLAHPTDTLIILHEKLRWLERINDHVMAICQSCVGRGDIVDCISLDCPVLYRRTQVQRDLSRGTELRRIIENGGNLEF